MSLFHKLSRRRWIDVQTVVRLAAWWARRSRASDRAALLEDRPRYSHVPALTMIVGVRREDADLHVELFARRVVLDERPLVLAQDGAGTTPERREDPALEGRTSTITLSLN